MAATRPSSLSPTNASAGFLNKLNEISVFRTLLLFCSKLIHYRKWHSLPNRSKHFPATCSGKYFICSEHTHSYILKNTLKTKSTSLNKHIHASKIISFAIALCQSVQFRSLLYTPRCRSLY